MAQGANDPRVKKAESEQIVIALRDRGFPVEYILAPDEGHGFQRPVNSMALWAASETFFAKHIGGRFQEGATPEVATRLKEITVDPKTVVLSKAVDAAAVGVPKVVASLSPGSVELPGEDRGRRADDPDVDHPDDRGEGRGVGRHRHREDADGRRGRRHDARQGDPRPAQALDQAGAGRDRARRSRAARPPARWPWAATRSRCRWTSAASCSPTASGGHEAIGALPLAEGYSTTFRNFDVRQQKVQLKQAKVAGSEKVTVPAGTFEAWKVEIASADGEPGSTTIWVAKDTRKVVKTTATLPQMGGAVVTTELQP